MKKLIIMSLLLNLNVIAYAQEDKTVTLVVSGQGKTQVEAKQNALRSAIEQAFGTFISSKTEILNDNLVKDEIVSVANGNIQKFEIISEVQIPNGLFATSLKATVSVTKLTSFVEGKGFEVEFKGSLFGANLKQQRMNEDAEWKSILNLCEVSNKILSNSLDYSIEVGEPVKAQNKRSLEAQTNDFQILFTIKSSPNSNFDKFVNYFNTSIKAISMPDSEKEAYQKLNKQIYFLTNYSIDTLPDSEKEAYRKLNEQTQPILTNYNIDTFFFRNPNSGIALQNLFMKSNQYLHNFKVITNLDTILDTMVVKTCCSSYDGLATQNMYSYQDMVNQSEIWHLNSRSGYGNDQSSNNNPGYPQFNFVVRYTWNKTKDFSSWSTYFEYLYALRNNQILFDTKTYFTETGRFYKENGESYQYEYPEYPYINYPGIVASTSSSNTAVEIGAIKLKKIDYYSNYLAIYSEEEISKIKNISVKQLK
jgi:hypothetical protein